jgi:hypothetical protein
VPSQGWINKAFAIPRQTFPILLPLSCWIYLPRRASANSVLSKAEYIPGHPGNKMGMYMEPLIDELVRAKEEGVWMYDRATKTNFRMHVWYQYSMHDLPAYRLFCAWCVHGKFPCPVCTEALRFIWLKRVANIHPSINIDNFSLLTIHSA